MPDPSSTDSSLRDTIRAFHRRDEAAMAAFLLTELGIERGWQSDAAAKSAELVRAIREIKHFSPVDALMREYDLSSEEGTTLMELAEALLRIPDTATRDTLIRDKITDADWVQHLGHSPSLLVNLSTIGLDLGARLLSKGSIFSRLTGRIGAPVLRAAIGQAMRYLGDRFVFAETIGEALNQARSDQLNNSLARYSFDMLGESARTWDDAERYYKSYSNAIAALSATGGTMVEDRSGISIKLSALNPRYELTRADAVKSELLPVLLRLAEQAAAGGIGFTIDAEEADRLDLSLDLFESLALDPSLAGWNGLGLAVQAYQKRALPVIDWVIDLARRSKRRIMVRLVKGAYWDSEIKRAQQEGLDDYPLYTRKVMTDLSYLAAARKMLAVPDALYPMFATHNAYTVAAVHAMAGPGALYEFQRLHGMGSELYANVAAWNIPCRIYAPVGPYRDLLAYLVRRLLENGANSSFVNQLADRALSVEQLVQSPADAVKTLDVIANPRIVLPKNIYGPARQAAPGIDFGDPEKLAKLAALPFPDVTAVPLIDGKLSSKDLPRPVMSPADQQRKVGTITETSLAQIDEAVAIAETAYAQWAALPALSRARLLEKAADLLVEERDSFLALLVHEAGRTVRNAVGEWREAVDFLRYYADQAIHLMAERDLPGPVGESNRLSLTGKGVFACISPWNFPLSIFLGQIAAALVTGNTVLAKPAGETPLIGFMAIKLLHRAGIPGNVLHYLPGGGEVGAALVAHSSTNGVVFTGSTATVRKIALSLAAKEGPPATLIAETGGQNAMIVDSSALLEQAVGDIVASAFDSAGQRCSALRILAVQEDIADVLIAMVQGAMATLTIGDPAQLATDIGPVINERARDNLLSHLIEVKDYGRDLTNAGPPLPGHGSFFAPRLIEIDRIDRLTHEVFGPVLHVVRWKGGKLEELVQQINATGYGLTLGLQTRIDEHVQIVRRLARVGNFYVNRSQIGAVVESQPFGGEGLSGTGPKAGGPHYLGRFVTERVMTVNTAAAGGDAALLREE